MKIRERECVVGIVTALRLHREAINCPRWKLERELNILRGTLAKYETADKAPQLSTLIRWASALGLEPVLMAKDFSRHTRVTYDSQSPAPNGVAYHAASHEGA